MNLFYSVLFILFVSMPKAHSYHIKGEDHILEFYNEMKEKVLICDCDVICFKTQFQDMRTLFCGDLKKMHCDFMFNSYTNFVIEKQQEECRKKQNRINFS